MMLTSSSAHRDLPDGGDGHHVSVHHHDCGGAEPALPRAREEGGAPVDPTPGAQKVRRLPRVSSLW